MARPSDLAPWLAILLLSVSVIGYSCVTSPPAQCVGWCSDDPCWSEIGCGFDCVCIKVGSEQEGFCARVD